jgi:hypothetical protein
MQKINEWLRGMCTAGRRRGIDLDHTPQHNRLPLSPRHEHFLIVTLVDITSNATHTFKTEKSKCYYFEKWD